ncbi:hypothetical protein [Hymenobacter metallilatus]|uniref:Uncharacterized protein n=1 Tax=Hymenobacter metallilatus TaxID=2493666 RepID=A0A428IYE8_9BACT|nr:hypothetical protein [Hymenobacter metallilatus]RSK24177.1 hypothetical protein EI290_20570 [Hymenobacter metallilatus]
MKKALFSLLLAYPFTTYAQALKVGRVDDIDGKYVFYYMKPVAAYDVAFTFTTPPMPACGIGSERSEAMVKAALMEAGTVQKPFDAIVVGNGTRDMAIRFRNNTPSDSMALCRPMMIGSTAVFFLAEPASSWTPTEKVKTVWWDGVVNGQCLTTQQITNRGMRKFKNPKTIVVANFYTYNAVPAKEQ